MNFLSHYYFDRNCTDHYHILGTVLPDLVKNADKKINLHPEKQQLHTDEQVKAITRGWKKHMDVDRLFHSSDFFNHHSHQLKLALKPAVNGSPVKPFFLGHIALELLLDNLLITTGKINVNLFYDHLDKAENVVTGSFFNHNGFTNHLVFFNFFAGFKKHRYLTTYAETGQVAYALKRVCMRIWPDPFTATHEAGIHEAILNYRALLVPNFMGIFDEIEYSPN